jgi:hypothetical protein
MRSAIGFCIRAILPMAMALSLEAAQAQTVCRNTALGGQRCRGGEIPPPMARPPLTGQEEGLEGVRRAHPDLDTGPDIVPARKRNRLGTTLPDRPVGAGGMRCRTDRLGNLVCR